jgi:CO/xanthine dehydrogenase Mo-binding subunit
MSILGTRVVRTEDPRLLTAGGTYTDDLRLPELAGAARVTFVRSPVAHARVTAIDTEAARDAPGVVAVLTAADLDDLPPGDGSATAEPLLAADRVRHVGEAVAIVVTEGGYQGEDAAELVSVDYEPLPAVASISDALDGGPLLFDGTESNVAAAGGEPPTATELPSFELLAMETPTKVNPLGVKGIGEAGTIGATPAALSAVVDAVAHLGVRHIDMPATPLRVWTAISEARASA